LKIFEWNGIDGTAQMLALRLSWIVCAFLVTLLAVPFFDRFDEAMAGRMKRRRRQAQAGREAGAGVEAEGIVPSRERRNLAETVISALTSIPLSSRFGRMLIAELRLMLKGVHTVWYLGAIGFIIAGYASPVEVARHELMAFTWIWPVLLWSKMGMRETYFGTAQLIFSAPRIRASQMLAVWGAGVIVAMVTGSGVALNLAVSGEWGSLPGMAVGMFFIPSLTGMVGFWATLSLNIPDFTRYARSQKEQMLGQLFGLPVTMALYSFIGVAVTSATVVIYGEAIWDPVVLLSKFQNPLVILLSMLALTIATLTTNIAANVVAPANGFSNLAPKKISFVKGGLITAFIGVVMMPWKLLEDYSAYIFGWLVGYSSFLGPIAGVLIADYFLIRKQRLSVIDLYTRGGEYEYSRGFNPRAILALSAGVFVALIGLLVEQVRFLYDYAWFVGFGVAFVVYVVSMKR